MQHLCLCIFASVEFERMNFVSLPERNSIQRQAESADEQFWKIALASHLSRQI